MDFYKIMMFLLINLLNTDFNMAQESDISQLHTISGVKHVTYDKYPFDAIFGGAKVNMKKSLGMRRRRDADVDEKDLEGNKGRAVYWIPTSCDSLAERGYTCLSCGESLHCMGGNFALKAICGGRRPFCSNGVCSDIRGEKCRRDEHIVQAPHINNVTNIEATSNSTLR